MRPGIIALLALLAFGSGCFSPNAGIREGIPFVGITSSTQTTATPEDVDRWEKLALEAERDGQPESAKLWRGWIAKASKEGVHGSDPGGFRGQFWDFRNPVETGKSLASIGIALLATYVAVDAIADELGADERERQRQHEKNLAASLDRSTEKEANIIEGNNNQINDLPQDRATKIRGDGNVIDFQQDTQEIQDLGEF
jgi:hypothetical protein